MYEELVNFRIRDAYHPSPQALLQSRFGDNLLQGRVVEYVSRQGPGPGGEPGGEVYAVVELPDVPEFVLVPRRCASVVGRNAAVR